MALKPSDIIHEARSKLTAALLQIDRELVLDAAECHLLLTQQEFLSLSEVEDPRETVETLIDIVLAKGNWTQNRFIDCLENMEQAFPDLLSISKDLAVECKFPEEKRENPSVLQEAKEDVSKDRSEALNDFLSRLKLLERKSKKFSLQDVLEISLESLKKQTPQTPEDLPWHFLRKVLALNVTARNTALEQAAGKDERLRGKDDKRIDETLFCATEKPLRPSMNPLDVLCAVLLCSDSFLQQEILSRMSLCQFALPLLLPPLETPTCTLMLWAMRDIVKKWRPHSVAESRGFKEESLVEASMPTISFVRMGRPKCSKSKLLNEFLCPSQQHHDYFIHRDMECGNAPREISEGLVEMAWYFPGGQKSLDLFPEPVSFANLRGDVELHRVQFSFLTQVSSAVFILTEHIGQKEYDFLLSLKDPSTQYYFILECQDGKSKETLAFLNKLVPVLKANTSHMLLNPATTNKAEFVGKLRSIVLRIINLSSKRMNIEEKADVAHELSIQVDEDFPECQNALRCAKQITEEIKDVVNYKKEMLKLQGALWREVTEVEKELCRMERPGELPLEQYRSKLIGRLLELRQQQYECDLTVGLTNFINGIQCSNSTEKHFFLKWMKFKLDHISRANLAKLQVEYKEKCKMLGDSDEIIMTIVRHISCSSLGVEHFIRELGQYHEAEHLMVKESKTAKNKRQFLCFPSIAANLMLEGFPLELVDGDAANIPLQWIADVLTELNNKVGGQSKVMVITVLGVQGTGKSTLLNTVFGLQFAVSSGRCTRGAFMTLLKVRENLLDELGCDFILVIDTEGLKAPELAKLEDSYRHDNELAALVIGLSDITIVNLAMENAAEMKSILQTVTRAFLRRGRIGQKPSCQFVHQNVSDISAHDQNMKHRKYLLEQLDRMTQAVAKMEEPCSEIKFSDIMEYDLELHDWYISGFWQGIPPMAPVSRGYSERVLELKEHLFECLRKRSANRTPRNIPDFIEWMKSLWNAGEHEDFIFV